MQLSPRSVRRWAQKLRVPPTVPGHACQRWSQADAEKLIDRWVEYWRTRHPSPRHLMVHPFVSRNSSVEIRPHV